HSYSKSGVIKMIDAMLAGRLRFITFCDVTNNNDTFSMRRELSFGQIVSLTMSQQWKDPDIDMQYYIHIPHIRDIVWSYVIDLPNHIKFLESKISFQNNQAVIEIIPNVILCNYKSNFELVNSTDSESIDYELKS